MLARNKLAVTLVGLYAVIALVAALFIELTDTTPQAVGVEPIKNTDCVMEHRPGYQRVKC